MTHGSAGTGCCAFSACCRREQALFGPVWPCGRVALVAGFPTSRHSCPDSKFRVRYACLCDPPVSRLCLHATGCYACIRSTCGAAPADAALQWRVQAAAGKRQVQVLLLCITGCTCALIRTSNVPAASGGCGFATCTTPCIQAQPPATKALHQPIHAASTYTPRPASPPCRPPQTGGR